MSFYKTLSAVFVIILIGTFLRAQEEKMNKEEPTFSNELVEKAEMGDPESQYNLGRVYQWGKGAQKNEQEAIYWYFKSADKEYPKAMTKIGWYYLNNKIDDPLKDQSVTKTDPEISFSRSSSTTNQPQHLQKALTWLMKAAEKEEPGAKYLIGEMYAKGIGLEKNESEAIKWWEESASQNYIAAQGSLSFALMNGKGCEKNPKKAFDLIFKAATTTPQSEEEKNFINGAQFFLATYYYEGWGVEKDLSKSFEWAKKSAESGSAVAQNMLGNLYNDGQGTQKNVDKAIEWYKRSASQKNPKAEYQLGYYYENGIGFEKDYKKAFDYYFDASKKGLPEAQNNLARLYFSGQGTTKNESEAFKNWLRSALQKNCYAYGSLGMCYEDGIGVKKDYGEAVKWYKKGAEADVPHARYRLARCYENGIGVEKNTEEAKLIYSELAMQNYETAKEAVLRLENKETSP